MTVRTHPAERIPDARFPHPLADLSNVAEVLRADISTARDSDPDDRTIAELVWLAGRAQAEALTLLAARLGVDSDDLRGALEDPENHPDLAQRADSLVSGLARWV